MVGWVPALLLWTMLLLTGCTVVRAQTAPPQPMPVRTLVTLVPGLCGPSSPLAFVELTDLLKSAGYDDVLVFRYTSSQDFRYAPVDQLFDALKQRVEGNA